MSIIKRVFILAGHFAGKTVQLGDYSFVDGRCEIIADPTTVELHARALERNWQALSEGDPRIAELNAAYKEAHANVQREVSEGSPGPAGQADVLGNGVGSAASADSDPVVVGSDAGAATGEAGSGAEAGNGSPEGVTEPKAPVNEKLARAIASLDPANDTHWTADGRPAMKAVEAAYGASDVTRADVDAAAPGFLRPAAT